MPVRALYADPILCRKGKTDHAQPDQRVAPEDGFSYHTGVFTIEVPMHLHKKMKHRSALGDWWNERQIDLYVLKDRLSGYQALKSMAKRRLGYVPNIETPRTFNEKVQWRKIYDRNPLFPIVADKYRVRDYIEDKLGAAQAARLLPRLVQVVYNADDIDFDALPDDVVFKANHGSGWNLFLRKGDPVDRELIRNEVKYWLRRSYGRKKWEWAYHAMPRCVVIEELILDDAGNMPDDMKFQVFDGNCGFVTWDDDRFGAYTQHFMNRDFNQLDFTLKPLVTREIGTKPKHYEAMLALAEQLGAEFDSIRVDYLFNDDGFWINELTLYRGSGMEPFDPPEFDERFGALWTLPTAAGKK
jgi:hypothetical protein